ncbi:hypothetical protein L2E82_36423 [Cichorium intybus]|uniref:Uncharacterized protein n=1 Tax=Cichorium intybus TaxID=13427 RepID=A0ACB9BRK4_CICIN|nr:hypothetical protein L2E82_36423 [Cichorium intybus]
MYVSSVREDALRARFRIQGYDSTQIEEEGARLHLLLAINDYATLHSLKIDTIRDDCTAIRQMQAVNDGNSTQCKWNRETSNLAVDSSVCLLGRIVTKEWACFVDSKGDHASLLFPFIEILEAVAITDKNTGQSKGYAFISLILVVQSIVIYGCSLKLFTVLLFEVEVPPTIKSTEST